MLSHFLPQMPFEIHLFERVDDNSDADITATCCTARGAIGGFFVGALVPRAASIVLCIC